MDPQLKGMIDRTIAVIATMVMGDFVHRGWLGESNAAQLTPLLVVLVPALAWAWWENRPKNLLQKAASVTGEDGKKVVVLAPPELAVATPEKNIISTGSSTESIAAAIKTSVNGA